MKSATMFLLARMLLLVAVGAGAAPAVAQGKPDESGEELQKKLSNPVADLISVPFQYTGTFNVIWPDDAGNGFVRFQVNFVFLK